MADLAASRAAHKSNLSNAKRREIVVQHEALRGFRGIEQLDALFIVLGAKRSGHQRLGFTAREDCGTVSTREHVYFTGNRPDLIECTTVRAAMIFQHLVAE